MVTILIFLLILSVLVLIHEAGHYFVAKKFGIKVEEFGFGLPPRAWGKKIGETLYSINWLPIGGFVKLYGEDEAGAGRIAPVKNEKAHGKTKDFDRSYIGRPIWQRTAVVIAGVVMNTLLAVVIFYIFLALSGFKTVLPVLSDNPPAFIGVNQKIVPKGIAIGQVAPNSPAEKSGIKPGSILTSVNGKSIKNNNELVSIIKSNKGKEMTLVLFDLKTEKEYTTVVTPRVSPPKGEGALGIAFDFSPYNIAFLSYDTPVQKAFSGITHSYNLQLANFDGLRTLLTQSVTEKRIAPLSDNVAGPIGIGSLIGQIVDIPDSKERVLQLLNLAGLLSISLAFFNVLPIPGLDGGRLFFIIIEAIIGRKVNQRVEGYAHAIGMVLLITLIILITFKDISQLFK